PARGTLADYFAVTDRRRSHRHYGRFVGVTKILLLSLAAGLIGVLAIWPRIANKDRLVPIGSSTDVQLEDVESLHVKNARLTGTSRHEKPYTVTFEDAKQTSNESDLVLLTRPQADVEMKSGAWLALSAPKGRFHRAKRIIELDDSVELHHDSGLEVRTGSVTFNLETGTGAGYDPLSAQAPFGTFESQGFRIRDDTAVFRFMGPVRAILFSVPRLER
ncbi:MAG: LPS export ABC transporter periplasmic protein LptC, partial [Gammaproteobacteria bacterium]|nr:LPS export ABC transporter periplasmic protein LptC [Gammaproteobacteria bacterium]